MRQRLSNFLAAVKSPLGVQSQRLDTRSRQKNPGFPGLVLGIGNESDHGPFTTPVGRHGNRYGQNRRPKTIKHNDRRVQWRQSTAKLGQEVSMSFNERMPWESNEGYKLSINKCTSKISSPSVPLLEPADSTSATRVLPILSIVTSVKHVRAGRSLGV